MLHRLFHSFMKKKNSPRVFDQQYRNGYKKLWIDNLCDYSP